MKLGTFLKSLFLFALSCDIIQGGVLTVRDQLYTDIFTNYSAKSLPVQSHETKVTVTVLSQIININSFDEINGDLSVTITFLMRWLEERISWDPSEYSGITSITVSPTDLWKPKMFLLEASDTVKDLNNNSIQIRLMNNGSVVWLPASVLKVACSVHVQRFPFDKQTCEMTVLDWGEIITGNVIFVPEKPFILQHLLKANSKWELSDGSIQMCETIPPPCLSLVIVLNRRSQFYVIYIVVPLAFLGLINNLVFLMPPSSGERTSVAVTAFLSFVVYMDITNGLVPQSSDPVANIYYYIVFLMVYSSCIMFMCIVSLRIYNRKTDVPRWLQTMVQVLRFECMRSRRNKVNDKAARLDRKDEGNNDIVEMITDGQISDQEIDDSSKKALAKPGVCWCVQLRPVTNFHNEECFKTKSYNTGGKVVQQHIIERWFCEPIMSIQFTV